MQVDSHGKDLNHPYRKVNEMMLSEFPDFRVDTGVHERNSDTWEFGKGALSANGRKLFSVSGMGFGQQPVKVQMLKGKIHMTNNR